MKISKLHTMDMHLECLVKVVYDDMKVLKWYRKKKCFKKNCYNSYGDYYVGGSSDNGSP